MENEKEESIISLNRIRNKDITKENVEEINKLTKSLSPSIKEKSDLINKKNLSDKEVDRLFEIVGDECSDEEKADAKLIQDIKEQDNKGEGLTAEEADIDIDPISGEMKVGEKAIKKENIALTDINKDSLEAQEFTKDAKAIVGSDLSSDDSMQLLNVIGRFERHEKFSVYNALPESVKASIRQMAKTSNIQILQGISKEILKEFIKTLKINKEYIDFQESLKNELKIPNLSDMYADYLRDLIENKLAAKADRIAARAPGKARVLRLIIEGFRDSYTMNRELEFLNSHSSNMMDKMLKKRIKKFDHLIDEINHKYKDTKLVINDIRDAMFVLGKVLDKKYTDKDIEKFIAVYYYVTRNYIPEHLGEHSFMNYTISNIKNLQYGDLTTDFNQNLLNNIYKVLDKIREVSVE